MPINHQTYQSYVLRLWRPEETSAWRLSMRNILSGEEVHFARPAELVAFLEDHAANHATDIDRTSGFQKDDFYS